MTDERRIPETWVHRYADVSVEEVYVNFLDQLAGPYHEVDHMVSMVTLFGHIDRLEGRRPLTGTDLAAELERFKHSGMYAFYLN